MFSTLLWPIIPFILQVVFFGYYVTSAVYPFLFVHPKEPGITARARFVSQRRGRTIYLQIAFSVLSVIWFSF